VNGGRAVETLIPVGKFGMLTYPGTWAIPHTLPNKAFKWLTIGFASGVACFCWIGHFVSSFRLTKGQADQIEVIFGGQSEAFPCKKQMGCEISGCYRGPGINSRGLEHDAV
jgi:hypothetical protein